MTDVMNFPGTIEWSGENPGISLKADPNGPFVSVASVFRVMLSPHGRGHALMLMMSPQETNPPADRGNFCFSDNEGLARWLVSDFVSYFGAWKDTPGLKNLVYRPLESAARSGDARRDYSEAVKAGDMTIALSWRQLGKPFCFALPPDKSASGKHWMPSTFVPSTEASITVNGRVLPGKPAPREMAGQQITTAFLAFAETWIRGA